MSDILNEFTQYIEGNDTAVNTRQAYERDIKKLISWLASNGISEPADVGSAELLQYIDVLSSEGKSASTISRNIASIKKFFVFLKSRGYVFSNPAMSLKAPKVIRSAPSVLSDKDVRKLLSTPDESTAKGIRDKAMLELLVATGMCVSEIIGLKTEDVDVKSGCVTAGTGRRRISINKKTTDYLKNYSKIRKQFIIDGHEDDHTYFLSCAGDKMSRQGFWKILRICGNNAGIGDITPQMIRHSFAVSQLKHGKDAAALQKLLGHSSKAGSLEYQSYVMAL